VSSTTSTRCIYSPNGKPTFYRTGDNIYSQQGIREFWVSGTWWHSSRGAEYYESGNWIYAKDGQAAFYYS
jgi:hypothetical protein